MLISKLKVYGADNCPKCEQLINLLDSKSIDYEYLKVGIDYQSDELISKTGLRSLPQVFFFDSGEFLGLIEGVSSLIKKIDNDDK